MNNFHKEISCQWHCWCYHTFSRPADLFTTVLMVFYIHPLGTGSLRLLQTFSVRFWKAIIVFHLFRCFQNLKDLKLLHFQREKKIPQKIGLKVYSNLNEHLIMTNDKNMKKSQDFSDYLHIHNRGVDPSFLILRNPVSLFLLQLLYRYEQYAVGVIIYCIKQNPLFW